MSSKLPLIEIQYLPPTETLWLWVKYEEVIIEQWENYQKGSYRNRAYIMGANGRQRLSIPLLSGKNKQMPIREVRIDNSESWQSLHWRSIRSGYGSAPFFEWYAPIFEPYFQKKYTFLFDWNLDLLEALVKSLQLRGRTRLSENFVSPGHSNNDWRGKISPSSGHPANDLKYNQVFEDKHGFVANLSGIDLLFCTGPEAQLQLKSMSFK